MPRRPRFAPNGWRALLLGVALAGAAIACVAVAGLAIGDAGAGQGADASDATDAVNAGDGAAVQADGATVAFSQTATGNVFLANETATVGIESDAERVAWALERHGGERVGNGSLALDSDGEATLTLPTDGVGHYEVRAWPAGATEGSTATTVAMLPADGFENDDRFYGMSTHFGQGWDHGLFDMLAAAGVATIRDEHAWMNVERTRGSYDFAGPAQAGFMEEARERGLDRLFLLAYGNPVYGGEWNHVPHDRPYRRAFANYTRAVLDRYPALDHVEVWNEPNLAGFRSGPAAGDTAAYEKLAAATSRAVDDVRGNATVVGGSTAAVSPDGNRVDYAFWEGVLRAGAGEHLDALSIHPYRTRPTNYSRDLARLRNLTREHNGGEALPIWVTEFGWRTGPRSGVVPATQARYLVASHVRLRAAGVERAYWYTFRDDGPPGAREDAYPFGLVRHPDDPAGAHVPKPSLAAYATMTRRLAGADRVTALDDAPVAGYRYEGTARSDAGTSSDGNATGADGEPISSDGNATHVLWSPTEGGAVGLAATDVTLRVDGPVTLTTMTGERRRLHPHDGEVYLTVGADPLYVTGDVGEITRGAPVSLGGSADGLRVGATGGGRSLTVAHAVADRTVEQTAAAGSTANDELPLPTVYRPMGPPGEEAFHLDGGQRVVDVVSVDGRAVGRLTTRVQPAPIAPPASGGPDATSEPDGVRRASETRTSETSAGGATATDGSTTGAAGPGFDVVGAVLAVALALATLLARRRGR